MSVKLQTLTDATLETIWKIGFNQENPEWKQWDAPYFEDYQAFASFSDFQESSLTKFLKSDDCRAIEVDGQVVGTVTRYWENKATRWLEIGITIYQSVSWGKAIGTKALEAWIDQTFNDYPLIERVGLTTWSGNVRMMHVAKKLQLKEEARIRKVRYWQNHYYDSMKYGILREEWAQIYKTKNENNHLKSLFQ